MTVPVLERIAGGVNYGDLPETWQFPDVHRFSEDKTLYDYQTSALHNAARILYLYWEHECGYSINEPPRQNHVRKFNFARYYGTELANLSISKYEKRNDRLNLRQNPVFDIISEYVLTDHDEVKFEELINRMGFWMATGSGKTLVMVKLIEYLHGLIQRKEIPPYNFLVLAPSDHLIRQIRDTIADFNQSGLYLDFVPLKQHGRVRQGRIGDAATVYYHRSDNISDIEKQALMDFRRYENDGKWYVFLDEAHKGGTEESKRQAYYSVMSRQGFLFNFSATFTDAHDITTTVKKYNLQEFVREGHGKRICLIEREFKSFRSSGGDIDHEERRRIVMKSLLNLAFVIECAKRIRNIPSTECIYHMPLMLTLVNSVNTDVEREQNDLWAFFQTLRDIATGNVSKNYFSEIKSELIADWKNSDFMFEDESETNFEEGSAILSAMSIKNLREAVFLSRTKGALQMIHSSDNKELAFQLKTADSPFALIRIGNTSRWRNQLLVDYEDTSSLRDKSFFDELESSPITILMGSRSFFESWDSNRPNVINFINIGVNAARKFIVQSVGRGVRVEPIPLYRRRLDFLPPNLTNSEEISRFNKPVETLFIYATNRQAIRIVLEGLESEGIRGFREIGDIVKRRESTFNGKEMLLLVPEYRDEPVGWSDYAKFSMSSDTLSRFRCFLEDSSDSLLIVRDGLELSEVEQLRERTIPQYIDTTGKDYANLHFLQSRLVSHFEQKIKLADGVRKLNDDDDIVHFRKIRVNLDHDDTSDLQERITLTQQGEVSTEDRKRLSRQFADGEIDWADFLRSTSGVAESSFKGLKIKNIKEHFYVPVLLDQRGDADYIQHIIKEESEIKFLEELENWLQSSQLDWDLWMFSKIDEYLDKVHIPYFDTQNNSYARFMPDFVFWMTKGNNYQIVFVDPKGTEHTSALRKIDGFMYLFECDNTPKQFKYKDYTVSVKLILYNENASVPQLYKRFWSDNPSAIFSSM